MLDTPSPDAPAPESADAPHPDTAFLLALVSNPGTVFSNGHPLRTMGARALVTVAYGGTDGRLPETGDDLAACYRVVMTLPTHRRHAGVLAQLARAEAAMDADYPGAVNRCRAATGYAARGETPDAA